MIIEEDQQIKPFIPIWNKGKNQLLKYEIRPFNDGCNNIADITYAIFIDKNKEQQEVVAWIKWK